MLFPLYDTNPHQRFPVVTVALIAANTLAFLWFKSLPDRDELWVLAHYGFVPARVEQFFNPQKVVEVKFEQVRHHPFIPAAVQRQVIGVVRLPPNRSAIVLSIFTMMFLHGGWMHLIGNMWFLWIFGNNIEDRLGPPLYVVFYLMGGVVAAFCHWAVASGQDALVPTVGASGAVSAVLGAYAISYPFTHIRTLVFLGIFITLVDLPALVVLGVWFIVQLLEAQGMLQAGAQKGVAFWAHVGGFVAGWVLMPLLAPKTDDRGAAMQKQMDELFGPREEERRPKDDDWRW